MRGLQQDQCPVVHSWIILKHAPYYGRRPRMEVYEHGPEMAAISSSPRMVRRLSLSIGGRPGSIFHPLFERRRKRVGEHSEGPRIDLSIWRKGTNNSTALRQ